MQIDWNFIDTLEGAGIATGYVPGLGSSVSGVTIASGVDLGQMNVNDLNALGLDQVLYNVLFPYLGLKQYDAYNFLQTHPLFLSPEQVQELTSAEQTRFSNALRAEYNSQGQYDFNTIPFQAQTVITSISYQYGLNIRARAPNFWNQALTMQWSQMYSNLMNFGDAYATRRHAEAQYLLPII